MAVRPAADPRAGVFETLLVVDGRPAEAEAHLERLAHSLRALYGQAIPEEAPDLLARAGAGFALGRVRLTAIPDATGVRLRAAAEPVDERTLFPEGPGARLRSLPVPGGIGAHKWAERHGLERGEDGVGPLVIDGEEALEAGWANLFAVSEGRLVTPPADGRILPGVTRAAVLEIARELGLQCLERQLGWRELAAAEEVFLTGSVRGIEPAAELDGTALAGAGGISRRLGGALRRRRRLPERRDDAPAPAAGQRRGRSAR